MGPLSKRCCPESLATLRAQQKQLILGERAVQMFPKGSPELPLPPGMLEYKAYSGTFHYNPAKIGLGEVARAIASERENDILGLGPFSKDDLRPLVERGEPVACVVERDNDGTEVRCALGTQSTIPVQLEYMKAHTKNPVGVEACEDILLERFFNGQQQHS